MIGRELAAFLEDGQAIHVGTRDAGLQPNGARAAALKVEDDGACVVVYVAEIAAARLLPDLQSNGQIAVVVCRPTDDRSCQVKGVFDAVRPARSEEEALVASQWSGFLDKLARIGIPPAAAGGWASWPALAVRLTVTSLYDQTPGPSAGAVLS